MSPNEAQGARCGHIDGKKRCGQYIIGEEYEFADEAAAINTTNARDAAEWAKGYAAGYRVGADGDELDAEVVHAPLPVKS